MFITVEGLACTGKTTVADLLASRLGAVHLPTVPPEYACLRNCFRVHEHLDARYLFFLSAVSLAATRIRRHLTDGRSVVAESYLARTVAFHRGMGSHVRVELQGLPRPDLTFRLVCNGRERGRRLRQRGTRHNWDVLAEEHAVDIEREYRRSPAHVIDTTAVEPSDAVQRILVHRLDGGCTCEDGQSLERHQDLLSAFPQRDRVPSHPHCVCGRGLGW
ncbi:MAG: hypothetical protein ACRDN9_10045 [Streptosporangiaceae bacterium]